jgi:hypothetical protein
MTSMPEFVEPILVSTPVEERPQSQISPENLRVKQPEPGPNDKCDEYTNQRLKEVCGKPGKAFVTLPATSALPNGVRVCLCEGHLRLHNARRFKNRAER